jgi:hypothetical protein
MVSYFFEKNLALCPRVGRMLFRVSKSIFIQFVNETNKLGIHPFLVSCIFFGGT